MSYVIASVFLIFLLAILLAITITLVAPDTSEQIDRRIANWLRDPDHPVRH